MITDILQTIINYGTICNQIKCMTVNSYTYENLYIYSLHCDELHNKSSNTFKHIDQLIIEQKKFNRLKILKCHGSSIYNVNHLRDSLEELECRYSSVNQNGISQLKKLRILNCNGNAGITDVNPFCETLEELDCGFESGIDENGISQLKKLRKLNCSNNYKIRNISFLHSSLESLNYGRCSLEYDKLFDIKKNRMEQHIKRRCFLIRKNKTEDTGKKN